MPDLGVHLTPSQLQVLRLMADGQTNAAIGRRLHVTESTVAARASRLRHVLGAHDRAHTVAIAYRLGLLHVGTGSGPPPCRCGAPSAAPPPERMDRPPPRRQLQVLHGIAHGLPNAKIGQLLYLTEDTVKSHARRLFKTLGARDRAHAVALGYELGLIAPGTVARRAAPPDGVAADVA